MKLLSVIAGAILFGAATITGATASSVPTVIPTVGGIELDFRTAPWSAGNSDPSIQLLNQGDFGDVTVSAANASGPRNLWWDNRDGFGIRGGENDEIDKTEQLTVEFSNLTLLEGIWFTDLFNSDNDGPANGNSEQAIVEFFASGFSVGVLTFFGEELLNGSNNGELFGSIGALAHTVVDKIVFSSTGLGGDEYSVAGIEGYPVPVPVPAALPLFLSGLLGLGLVARRRRKEAAA